MNPDNPTLYDEDTKSGNDSAFTSNPLAVGTHDYEITDGRVVSYQDALLGAAFTFKHLGTGAAHDNLYAVFGSHDVARRIAREKLKALGEAAGLGGKMTLDRLQNFVGKRVQITVTEHKVVGDKTYAQISTTYPAGGQPASAAPPAQTKDNDEIPMQHATDTASAPAASAPATATPAETAAPKAGSFAERRRQRLAEAKTA